MSIRAIITGASGMVGEGVLNECLEHPDVDSVLVIGRKTCGVNHSKLKEIIHEDFSDFSSIQNELEGYNAAFLCMGITSFRASEALYTKITYDMTLALAEPLSEINPDMTLCYVSGLGTNSSEKSRSMWMRVKGRTENALLRLPFKQAFMFRPGGMIAARGAKNMKGIYKISMPLMPLLRVLFPGSVHTLKALAQAMIFVAQKGFPKQHVEVKDIVAIAKQVEGK